MRSQTRANLAQELWFRGEVQQALRMRQVRTTVRFGDRTAATVDAKGGYVRGRFIKLRIHFGDDQFGWWQCFIVPTMVEKKPAMEITVGDLISAEPNLRSRETMLVELERFYGKLGDDSTMTLIHFEHRDDLFSLRDLLSVGALRIALEPMDNELRLEADAYTVPLIGHDYPAKTPVMWNAVYREFGLALANLMMVGEPEQSEHILAVLKRDAKYLGGGAGVGFKDEVISHLDEVDPLAEAIGSVNFVAKTPLGRLRGYNTDGWGYAQSLQALFAERKQELRGRKAVILGAGGTGNAVAFALAEQGMRLVILNRTVAKAETLARRVRDYFGSGSEVRFGSEDDVAREVAEADAVINVSTKGATGEMEAFSALSPARLPATEETVAENHRLAHEIMQLIPRGAVISDIVLGRGRTPMLAAATDAGFITLDGVPMVVNQGVEAFWILHGQELQRRGVTKEQVALVMRRAASGL